GPPARGRCDADGRFQLDGVAAGPARWTARADGFGWKVDHGELQTGRNHELRIALPPASSIRGRIEAATDGKPVANAVVAAGDPGTLAHRATRTGADGRYTLHSLGSGDVEVRAAHAVGRARGAVAVPAGGEARWDAVLGDAAGEDFVHGVVVDQQQRPLEGWSIVVRQKGHDPVARATDAQGRFRVPVARPDHLDVRAFAPGRLLTSFADAMARDQQAGTPVRLQVDTSATTSVAGRVLDASAAGAPATIGCWHYQRREYARYTADAEGRFTIPRAPLGTIDLTIEHPGHVAHETGAIELQRGLPVDLGTIHLSLGGGLHGQVLGPGGTAPPACTLTLVQQGSARQLNAEYDGGGYRFRGVPAGQHTLLVQGERIAGAALPVTIEPGVDTPLDLEIQLGLHRRVQVRVPPGGGRRVT
ncbi:MAG: carboxypeptidase regulatory-like domain-containing protein, partial [Planctomycetes bacterium]|nr:carboxypeptidase regulatory-like domain-containing protein [Planctomycetota bacterium]